MSAEAKLRDAARAMAERLRVFKKDAEYAVERGDATIPVAGYWEPADQAALDAYEQALLEMSGARPLFEDGLHV